MKYQWILFDADETLFRFDNFTGLKHMFSQYGVLFTEADYNEYQAINKPLWVEYQNGQITAEQLQTKRFQPWANTLAVPAQQLNQAFLHSMADICQALPDAHELVAFLAQSKVKMGLITNGFTQLQQIRLERTGFLTYFSPVVISEQVGVAKPDKRIFEHAFEKMGNPPKNNILMVGDTLTSDILGGINVGLDTCWLNHHNETHPAEIKPTYQVSDLKSLKNLLQEIQ